MTGVRRARVALLCLPVTGLFADGGCSAEGNR